jgi:hypothetical protein
VGVVGNAANSERLHVVGSRDPAHVSPKSRLEFFGDAGDPVPCGKNTMKEQAGFCVVGHRLAILMLSRPLRDFLLFTVTRHLSAKSLCMPGYSQSRLPALKIEARSRANLPRIYLPMLQSLVIRITIL